MPLFSNAASSSLIDASGLHWNDQWYTSRFNRPSHNIVPCASGHRYPSYETLEARLQNLRDRPGVANGNEFDDCWLPDIAYAQHDLSRVDTCRVALPMWAHTMVDRSHTHEAQMMEAGQVILLHSFLE